MSANPQVQSFLEETFNPEREAAIHDASYWEWKSKEATERLALAIRALEYIQEVMCDPPDTEDRRRIGEYCKATALDLSRIEQ